MRVELELRGLVPTGHDDRHRVQTLGDRGPEPHEGADALDEIAELGTAQQRIEGTAQAGAARARLDRVGHALLIRGHRLRRQRRESRLTHRVPPYGFDPTLGPPRSPSPRAGRLAGGWSGRDPGPATDGARA